MMEELYKAEKLKVLKEIAFNLKIISYFISFIFACTLMIAIYV